MCVELAANALDIQKFIANVRYLATQNNMHFIIAREGGSEGAYANIRTYVRTSAV